MRRLSFALLCASFMRFHANASAQTRSAPQLTRAPELIVFVEAPYPDGEVQNARDASVTLTLTIDAEGGVSDATVLESAGEALDQAALTAARQFRFRPAEIDGHPSAIRITYRYEFHAPPPASASLVGVVRARGHLQPLEGVRIRIENGPSTVSDAAGRFVFDTLTPGPTILILEGATANALRVEELLEAGVRSEVTYEIDLPEESTAEVGDHDDLEIVIVAPTVRREALAIRVDAEEARRVPGTSGDVLRVVESLPGVARSAVGAGQLVVWGAAPDDTRIYVDGVRIPRLYHEGGLRSVIAPDQVESIELVPGGYGAAFGRGLGGIVSARTRTPSAPGVHGSLAVDPYDASASLRGSLDDVWRGSAAARVSWLHLLAEAAALDLGHLTIPRYWDSQARIAHRLGAGEEVELVFLLGGDRVHRVVPNADPALTTGDARELDWNRLYVRYQREGSDGSRTSIVPFIGWEKSLRLASFGAVDTSIGQETFLGGLRASHRMRAAPILDVEIGLDAEVAAIALDRHGSLGLPAREGDQRIFGQPPPDALGTDDWNVVQVGVAPYAEGDFALVDGTIHVVPGLRIDPYARTVSRRIPLEGEAPTVGLAAHDFVAEPRLSVRWDPLAVFGLRAAGGFYRQQPSAEDLSATFGNPALPSAQAWQVLLGGTVRPIESLSIEVTSFASFEESLSMRSLSAAPLRAASLVADGWGRAYGLQALVRLSPLEGFSGWIAYTLSRSERQDAAGEPWRTFDYDQTHVLTALLSYVTHFGFEAGARFRYATGMPRTPVVGAYYDALRDRAQPIFGARAGERLPEFVQLDLRIGQRIDLGGTELELWLEVQNVTNQVNGEEFVYSPDFSRRDIVRSTPILPVLGARWTF